MKRIKCRLVFLINELWWPVHRHLGLMYWSSKQVYFRLSSHLLYSYKKQLTSNLSLLWGAGVVQLNREDTEEMTAVAEYAGLMPLSINEWSQHSRQGSFCDQQISCGILSVTIRSVVRCDGSTSRSFAWQRRLRIERIWISKTNSILYATFCGQ